MPTFRFQGFTLRPAIDSDLEIAKAWTEADPDHRGITKPEFWLENVGNANSFLLEDAFGPVFLFRMDVKGNEVAAHIQFPPDEPATRRRVMQGLTLGFAWLEKILSGQRYKTLFFNSTSIPLINFCQKRLGFTWDGRRLEKALG
jgi:hypothetical protein